MALDQCFQVLAAALPFPASEAEAKVYMPVSVDEGFVYQALRSGMHIVSRITEHNDDYLKGDIRVFDADENLVAEIIGCKAIRLDQRAQGGVRDIVQSLFQPGWIEADLDFSAMSSTADEHFVILADAQGLGERLSELLAAEGRPYTLVSRQSPCRESEHRLCLNGDDSTTLAAALARVGERCQTSVRLIYLWGMATEQSGSAHDPRDAASACKDLLRTMQTIEQSPLAGLARVFLVTRGAQVQDGDPVSETGLAQAALWGLGRVMGHQEYADAWAGMIDLDPRAPETEARRLLEYLTGGSGEDQVAFRGDVCRVLRLLPLAEQGTSLPARMRRDATYLITGGMGSLGLLSAEWLARCGARHLVLMGRSGLPERTQWHNLAPDHGKRAVVNTILQLENLGVKVDAVGLDVSDADALAELFECRAAAGLPPLRGVIHSAGVADPMLLNGMTSEHIEEIFQPKVNGGWALHQALRTMPLDFFVLFSSVASVVTSPGQGAYAAANAYLDALAHSRRAQGLPAISVNWGPWGEVGMATQFNDLKTYFESRGMFPMRSVRGIEALEQVVGTDHPQALVLAADWKALRSNNYPPGVKPAFLGDYGLAMEEHRGNVVQDSDEGARRFVAEILPQASPEQRIELLANYLLDLAASVLRIGGEQRAALSIDLPFNRLGLDSMMAIELKNLIGKRLNTPVAVVDLLNGSPCSGLAQKLLDQFQLSTMMEKEETVPADA